MPAEQPDVPLPTNDFDAAQIVYRLLNVKSFVAYPLHSASRLYIGEVLPVRVVEEEVIS